MDWLLTDLYLYNGHVLTVKLTHAAVLLFWMGPGVGAIFNRAAIYVYVNKTMMMKYKAGNLRVLQYFRETLELLQLTNWQRSTSQSMKL